MRVKYAVLFFVICALAWSAPTARADNFIIYSQPDDSGEILSQQAYAQNTWISANIGNLFLGKERLSITFTMKDLHANITYHSPFGGVAVGTCLGCSDLQKYYFTDADRTLLLDGAFHTFTVQTGTTTLGIADGETPVYITFFALSQYYQGTHLKSDAAGTVPFLTIESASQPTLPPVPQAPEGSVTVYEQSDKTGVMSSSRPLFQNAYVDSASLGNLNLGQGQLYLTFTLKSPRVSSSMPGGVCIAPMGQNCAFASNSGMQKYYFTAADRALFSDQAYHTFTVLTGTTTSAYADGTRPVNVGFFNLYQVPGDTKIKSNADATIPYLIIKKPPPPPPPPDPCIAAGNCASNVLFLPGIEGSRLYEGNGCGKTAEEKLWEPLGESLLAILRGAGDKKVKELYLDSSGASVCADVYAKTGDVIGSVRGSNIYKSFLDEMNALAADGTIADWKPVAYDWRLSLDDLLNKGAERGGKIFYAGGDNSATSTPYLEQTLRALAGSSKTKKVSIVAHSNGGLLVKALLNKLGDAAAAALVDKIIMVGAPQSGAPVDVGALLFGYDQGISSYGIPILRSSVARALALNSPMAYHLLPSEDYLESTAGDSAHPVARFAGAGYAKELAAYGSTIGNKVELADFLLAKEGGREKPRESDVNSAEVANATLIDYAASTHAALDFWAPPAGVEVSEIAGWGVDTVAGIDFYTLPAVSALASAGPVRAYRPLFTEDGDGTVPVPSALMMASSTNVKRYWVDIFSYNDDSHTDRRHRDLFEIPSLLDFVKNIIKNSTSTLPAYISSSQPAPITPKKKLTFFLHSPLTLELTDSAGNITGLATDGAITQDIPDSTYGEFGEVKYITVPQGSTYQLTMRGQESGTFSLEMQESLGGVVTASSTIANVPTTPSTLASLTISGGLETASALTVDTDGDGGSDLSVTPRVGETVNYEPPPPALSETSQGTVPAPKPASPVATRAPRGAAVWSFSIPVTPPASVPIPAPAVIPAETVPSVPLPAVASFIASATPVTTAKPRLAAAPNTVKQAPASPPPTSVVETMPDLSQTASVYAASQQPMLNKVGAVAYTNLYRIWTGLRKIFSINK